MINLTTLPDGARIRLKDGGIAQVLDNPRDGMWLIVCREGGDNEEEEEMVHADQVVGLA